MNYTIVVPEGTTDHGNPQLLCTPARWYDYIFFIFANYLAHAATVVPIPGQDIEASICAVLLALMLPGSAVARSVTVILRRPATHRQDPLRCAARAGALCIVLKKPTGGYWAKYLTRGQRPTGGRDVERGRNAEAPHLATTRPIPVSTAPNDTVTGSGNADAAEVEKPVEGASHQDGPAAEVEKEKALPAHQVSVQGPLDGAKLSQSSKQWDNPKYGYEPVPHGSQIHGEYWLDKDYYLALLPPTGLPNLKLDVGEEPSQEGPDSSTSRFRHDGPLLSCSYNFAKLMIGLLQSIWAFITIYRARGNQIQQYGYAAFGLTVAPYATMSIINTIANLLTPEYPSVFVVRTSLLTRLEGESKARFQGTLNVVEISESQDEVTQHGLASFGASLDSLSFPSPDNPISLGGFIQGISIVLSLVPLAIVGGLSGFRSENSTQMERGFTMSWLVLGIVYGALHPELSLDQDFWFPSFRALTAPLRNGPWSNKRAKKRRQRDGDPERPNGIGAGISIVLIFATPVFGGMAIVGKMIHEFGVCTLLRG
ncbi:hypothetical protein B0T14DRAFT_514256 [Immersiella caudata]|uniref:Uncharacterized protein n=1 Tax=Immersiella caudata TaxID=314043 RepID=A0AA40C372_9PEZI|nr:hypothetical protein B0T14DRAFT_514256 [Immersiella caudata]